MHYLGFYILFFLISSCSPAKKNLNYVSIHFNDLIGAQIESSENLKNSVSKVVLAVNGSWKFCTSAYIGHDLFLTAAHCHKDLMKSPTFYNSYFLLTNDTQKLTDVTSDFLMHDFPFQFDTRKSFSNDLSLLKPKLLQNPKFAFKLPEEKDSLPENLYISSYGSENLDELTNKIDTFLNHRLRTIEISSRQLISSFDIYNICLNDNQNCQSIFKNANEDIKNDRIYCFSTDQIHQGMPYHGDSGGPLYSVNSAGELVLQGIFSIYLVDGSRTKGAFCYTNIKKYLNWINNFSH